MDMKYGQVIDTAMGAIFTKHFKWFGRWNPT